MRFIDEDQKPDEKRKDFAKHVGAAEVGQLGNAFVGSFDFRSEWPKQYTIHNAYINLTNDSSIFKWNPMIFTYISTIRKIYARLTLFRVTSE